MKIKRSWILPFLLMIGIITLSLYAYNQIMEKTIFGEKEIKNRVESLFNGKVQSISKTKDHYEVTFSKNGFLYEVTVDETEGTFAHITLIKEGTILEEQREENPTAEEETVEEQLSNEESKAVKPLTEQQVIEIAQSQFRGVVDEIEFVGTNDGGYYNVDIENDEDEATLQIHALTGEILTITYDD